MKGVLVNLRATWQKANVILGKKKNHKTYLDIETKNKSLKKKSSFRKKKENKFCSIRSTEFIETRQYFSAPHSSHLCLCIDSHKISLRRNKLSSVLKNNKTWENSAYYKETSKTVNQLWIVTIIKDQEIDNIQK